MTKGVVYTCLFGWKEELIFEPFESSDADFVVFSDRKIDVPAGCRLIILEDTGVGPERLSRRPKLLPHKYFFEYDWSLYVDNRAKLKMSPDEIYKRYMASSNRSLVCFKHPNRNCAYNEAEVVIGLGFDKETRVREQMDTYRAQGFPKKSGLVAGTVLLRNHHDHRLVRHHEDWYEHVMRFSKRDQLSFDYLRWKHKLPITLFEGSLDDNQLMDWLNVKRLPSNFDIRTFKWLTGLGNIKDDVARQTALEMSGVRKLPSPYVWQLERLFNKYKSDKGTRYYNAHGYCFAYETILRSMRKERFSFLEVGLLRHDVQRTIEGEAYSDAPSLRAWAEYFPKANIAGFDIKKFVLGEQSDRIKIYQGDSSSKEDIEKLIESIGERPKVVIEDASHASHHQQIFLGEIIEHIAPGGHFFMEDLHFQPKELEQPDAPKTINVLRSLAMGETTQTPYLSIELQKRILERAETIEFFDSREVFSGKVWRDALCYIRIKND